jgi:hypothetical protein
VGRWPDAVRADIANKERALFRFTLERTARILIQQSQFSNLDLLLLLGPVRRIGLIRLAVLAGHHLNHLAVTTSAGRQEEMAGALWGHSRHARCRSLYAINDRHSPRRAASYSSRLEGFTPRSLLMSLNHSARKVSHVGQRGCTVPGSSQENAACDLGS